MALKRSACATDNITKRPRNVINLEIKLKVIEDFEAGKRAIDISREYGIPATTVRTIVGDKQKYKDLAELGVPRTIKIMRSRDSVMVKMESLLMLWIADKYAKCEEISMPLIQQKAKKIFDELKSKDSSCNVDFVASKGWWERFKVRTGTRGVIKHNEAFAGDFETNRKYSDCFEMFELQARNITASNPNSMQDASTKQIHPQILEDVIAKYSKVPKRKRVEENEKGVQSTSLQKHVEDRVRIERVEKDDGKVCSEKERKLDKKQTGIEKQVHKQRNWTKETSQHKLRLDGCAGPSRVEDIGPLTQNVQTLTPISPNSSAALIGAWQNWQCSEDAEQQSLHTADNEKLPGIHQVKMEPELVLKVEPYFDEDALQCEPSSQAEVTPSCNDHHTSVPPCLSAQQYQREFASKRNLKQKRVEDHTEKSMLDIKNELVEIKHGIYKISDTLDRLVQVLERNVRS